MRIVTRRVLGAAEGWVRAGCALVMFGLAIGAAPTARADTLDPSLLPNVEAATFEVVAAKPTDVALTYAQPLPLNLLPYQQRTDHYHSIGTAFAIGPNRYVTAGHVLLTGLNSLWGPPALRDGSGHVYAIDKILKFSLRKDFVVFSLKAPPKTSATLPINTHPVVNQRVYAVGNALGTGVVIRGGLYTSNTPENQDGDWKWIRFSAPASPGNSGGPLLDENGKVIGVVLMKSPNENLNYALPMREVLDAPAHMAVMNKRINYGFPLISDTRAGTFKARFELPMDLATFYATYLKHMHAYDDAQLKALLAANADTMFPHGEGSARLLYAAPTRETFPMLLTRQTSGDWALGVNKSAKYHLDDHGFVRFGHPPGDTRVVLFHLRKPDSLALADLHGHPEKLMRLLLKSGFLTRTIASSKTRITSLGEPVLNATHTDAWQRPWRIMAWPVPFANGLWTLFALPVPDGYVGFFAAVPASQEHDYLINMKAMTDFLYTAYAGTLAQWQAFLKETALLPAAFRHIDMDIDEGDHFRYRSSRLGFEVTPKVQAIDADSTLTLMFSFFRDHDDVVWGVSDIQLAAAAHGNDAITILRAPNPAGNPSAGYAAKWNKLLKRQSPYDGDVTHDDGVTSIAGVAGGKGDTKAGVLYVVHYQVNGRRSQKFMKSRFHKLMKSLQVYEQ